MPTKKKDFVELEKGSEENGLAQMLYDLLRQNLERVPQKMAVAEKLLGSTFIRARDINVEITVNFLGKDGIKISSGKKGSPLLQVETDSITIVDLSRLRVKWGIPLFFDETGRLIVKKLLKGEIKISGMFLHPLYTIRLLNVFSVM